MNPGDRDGAGAGLVYRRKSAELDRRLGLLDAWRDDATQLAGLVADTLMDGAGGVVALLANPLKFGAGQEPELRRLYGVLSCAALVAGEPEPDPLPPSHAEVVLDAYLAEFVGRLRAAVLTEARAIVEVRARA